MKHSFRDWFKRLPHLTVVAREDERNVPTHCSLLGSENGKVFGLPWRRMFHCQFPHWEKEPVLDWSGNSAIIVILSQCSTVLVGAPII